MQGLNGDITLGEVMFVNGKLEMGNGKLSQLKALLIKDDSHSFNFPFGISHLELLKQIPGYSSTFLKLPSGSMPVAFLMSVKMFFCCFLVKMAAFMW